MWKIGVAADQTLPGAAAPQVTDYSYGYDVCSVMKLKRRCGLIPNNKAPRPFATYNKQARGSAAKDLKRTHMEKTAASKPTTLKATKAKPAGKAINMLPLKGSRCASAASVKGSAQAPCKSSPQQESQQRKQPRRQQDCHQKADTQGCTGRGRKRKSPDAQGTDAAEDATDSAASNQTTPSKTRKGARKRTKVAAKAGMGMSMSGTAASEQPAQSFSLKWGPAGCTGRGRTERPQSPAPNKRQTPKTQPQKATRRVTRGRGAAQPPPSQPRQQQQPSRTHHIEGVLSSGLSSGLQASSSISAGSVLSSPPSLPSVHLQKWPRGRCSSVAPGRANAPPSPSNMGVSTRARRREKAGVVGTGTCAEAGAARDPTDSSLVEAPRMLPPQTPCSIKFVPAALLQGAVSGRGKSSRATSLLRHPPQQQLAGTSVGAVSRRGGGVRRGRSAAADLGSPAPGIWPDADTDSFLSPEPTGPAGRRRKGSVEGMHAGGWSEDCADLELALMSGGASNKKPRARGLAWSGAPGPDTVDEAEEMVEDISCKVPATPEPSLPAPGVRRGGRLGSCSSQRDAGSGQKRQAGRRRVGARSTAAAGASRAGGGRRAGLRSRDGDGSGGSGGGSASASDAHGEKEEEGGGVFVVKRPSIGASTCGPPPWEVMPPRPSAYRW